MPHAPGSPPRVYLTFDDGPNPEWTPALLDALAEARLRATFFLIAAHITPETAPIVKRMADEGHAIGLHTGSRRLMLLPAARLSEELTAAADRIRSITGVAPCPLFRPHAGWRSASMYDGLNLMDYQLA